MYIMHIGELIQWKMRYSITYRIAYKKDDAVSDTLEYWI